MLFGNNLTKFSMKTIKKMIILNPSGYREELENMVILNFQMAGQSVTQMKKFKKTSFAKTLSNIGKSTSLKLIKKLSRFFFSGGTVGLFCGLSILSIVELRYWILCYVYKCLKNMKQDQGPAKLAMVI